jgi:sulfur carrier protein ThiS
MHITYQGRSVETDAETVAGFLAAMAVDPAKAIVEFDGEVYAPGSDLAALRLVDGSALDVFRLTAGG